MADFATVWNNARQSADWLIDAGDLASDHGVDSAVIISLMTDRLADPDDFIPDGTANRRGCWMDMPVQGGPATDPSGSKLWLRTRAKATDATRRQIEADIRQALQWGVDDGVFASVDVRTWWTALGFLSGIITVYYRQPAGRVIARKYDLTHSPAGGFGLAPAFLPAPIPPVIPPLDPAIPDAPAWLAVAPLGIPITDEFGSIIEGLIVAAPLAGAVGLSWPAVPRATGYTVFRRVTGDPTWIGLVVVFPDTNVLLPGMPSGVSFDFAVRAENLAGASALSPIATAAAT